MAKRWWIIGFIALVIIISVLVVYFYPASVKECDSESCFNSAMSNCEKANWINDAPEASWFYSIKGIEDSSCVVNVKLLQAKKGAIDIVEIEGLDMDCSLTMGYVGNPQTDLSKCSGKLKEGMQDLMIRKMHAYILTNVGKISQELEKVI